MSDFIKKINRILVEVIVHVRVQKILQSDYSLVYTNSNESGFRRIFVFGTRFPDLLSIVTLKVSVVNGLPVSGILFCFGRKNEIRKEYLGTGF